MGSSIDDSCSSGRGSTKGNHAQHTKMSFGWGPFQVSHRWSYGAALTWIYCVGKFLRIMRGLEYALHFAPMAFAGPDPKRTSSASDIIFSSILFSQKFPFANWVFRRGNVIVKNSREPLKGMALSLEWFGRNRKRKLDAEHILWECLRSESSVDPSGSGRREGRRDIHHCCSWEEAQIQDFLKGGLDMTEKINPDFWCLNVQFWAQTERKIKSCWFLGLENFKVWSLVYWHNPKIGENQKWKLSFFCRKY